MPTLPESIADGSPGHLDHQEALHALYNDLTANPVGQLLGIAHYQPGADATLSTTSTATSDIDATNLAVTFTVPDSGRVIVRLTAYAEKQTSDVGQWGLREGTTDVVAPRSLLNAQAAAAISAVFVVSGLAAGTSKTWKWTWKNNAGTNGFLIYVGPTRLPPTMEVWSA